jgi:hypothetical protein
MVSAGNCTFPAGRGGEKKQIMPGEARHYIIERKGVAISDMEKTIELGLLLDVQQQLMDNLADLRNR